MIRKHEMERIKEFAEHYKMVHMHEFINIKDTHENYSIHKVEIKRGNEILLKFEKRTMYDFDNDTMGVMWIVINNQDHKRYMDSLFTVLKALKVDLKNMNEV